MKHRTPYAALLAVAAALAACSCSKEPSPSPDGGREIVLAVGDGFAATVDTRATPVTSVPGTLYWGASTGTATETVKWAASSSSVSSGRISTGKYQTSPATAYNWYVANADFTVAGAMTVSGNGTDIVAGRLAASTSTAPSVVLNHIFARTGTLTCNAQSGYTISGVSWRIVGKSAVNGTAGTYDMKSGAWTAASVKLSSDTALTSSSDMYLIPGTYTLKVTYTLARGDWTETMTKSCDVTLVGGKVNNVTCTAVGGDAEPITVSVSLTEWGTENHTPTLS